MKNTLLGNLLLAFGISVILAFLASRMCGSYPQMASWMGGECWNLQQLFESEKISPSAAFNVSVYIDQQTRLDAIQSLDPGVSEARDKLLAYLGAKAPLEIRKAALYALGQHGGDEYIEDFKRIALSDAPLELRKAAVHVLESIGSPAARKALIDVLGETIPGGAL